MEFKTPTTISIYTGHSILLFTRSPLIIFVQHALETTPYTL